MSKRGYAYTTVRSYVAGISFFNKLNNFEDVTQKFVIVKILEGFKTSRPSKDAKLKHSDILKSYKMFSFTLRVLCNLAYHKKAMKRDRKCCRKNSFDS
jgi:hypothetical protein